MHAMPLCVMVMGIQQQQGGSRECGCSSSTSLSSSSTPSTTTPSTTEEVCIIEEDEPPPDPPTNQSHICLVSIGLPGHVVPLIRLGEALLAQGFLVTIISHDRVRYLVEAAKGLQVGGGAYCTSSLIAFYCCIEEGD